MKWAPMIGDHERHPKETPWSIGWGLGYAPLSMDPAGLMLHGIPETSLQALMETAPGDTPRESVEDYAEMREVLADALEGMDLRELWIFTAKVNRGMSFRQIADELGLAKSYVHRIYHAAREHLQEKLGDNPMILARLKPLEK